jgi:hypothetical protein
MEWALIALMAAQAGYSIYASNEQQQVASEAAELGRRRSIQNQNRLVEEGFRRQRGATSGTVLGGTPLGQARQAQQQGSILSNATTQSRSLLGNTL